MDSTSILLVAATLGVNFGWQPDPHDPQAYEVVVQLEPQLVDAMRDGRAVPIESHIPASVHPIRKIRVVVGTGDLARTPLATTANSRPRTAAYPPTEKAAAAARQPAEPQLTVVRGQDSGNRYEDTSTANSRRYERLGATIGSEPIRSAPPLRSLLAEPATASGQTTPARAPDTTPDWAAAWDSAPATDQTTTGQSRSNISADHDTRSAPPTVGLPPLEFENSRSRDTSTASREAGSDLPIPDAASTRRSSPTAGPLASRRSDPVVEDRYSQPTIEFASPAAADAEADTPAEELPWLPLLGASMGLVASLAANLFLGWSYADARQKYRALVRKTTHAFQESAGVAA